MKGASMSEISRRGRYIVIQCQSRDQVHEIHALSETGEISDKITDVLVTDEILAELGLIRLRLKAETYNWELMTVRSEGIYCPF